MLDIQICQSCGIILRGKSKFCTGCGVTISKFSPTTLPVIAQSAAPLAVALDPDPLVLERTLNKVQYAKLGAGARSEFHTEPAGVGIGSYGVGPRNGNGQGNGNGSNGHGSYEHEPEPGENGLTETEYAETTYDNDWDATDTNCPPGTDAGKASAATQATSKLQSILGGATSRSQDSGGQNMSGLISLGNQETEVESQEQGWFDTANHGLPKREEPGYSQDHDELGYQDISPASDEPDYEASRPDETYSQAQLEPGYGNGHLDPEHKDLQDSREYHESRETSAYFQDQLEQSAAEEISPPDHDQPISSGIENAEYSYADNPGYQPSEEPSSHQPVGETAEEIVPPPAEPVSDNESGPDANSAVHHNDPGDFFHQTPSQSPAMKEPQGLPEAVETGYVERQPETDEEAAPYPVKKGTSSNTDMNPVAASATTATMSPVAATTTGAGMSPVASSPATMNPVAGTFGDAGMPPSASSKKNASAPSPSQPAQTNSSTAGFNAGGFGPAPAGGMDFFASSGFGATPAPPSTSPVNETTITAASGRFDSEPPSFETDVQPDPETEIDLPEGTPSIVAQAVRAATTNTKLSALGGKSASKAKLRDSGDDSDADGKSKSAKGSEKNGDKKDAKKGSEAVSRRSFSDKDNKNRGQSKDQSKDQSSKIDKNKVSDKPSITSRKKSTADDSDEEEDDDIDGDDESDGNSKSRFKTDESEPTIKFGQFAVPRKAALIGILGACVGLPLLLLLFGLLGSLVTSGGSSGVTNLAGTWQFGVADVGGGQVKGSAYLEQSGNNFTGKGVDKYGPFLIAGGQYNYPKVGFCKVYIDRNNQPLQKPIQFAGQVDWVNPEPGKGPFYAHMYGQWMLSKREGYGWRGHPVTYVGKWEAGLSEVALAKNPDGSVNQNFNKPANPIGAFFGWVFGFPQPGDPHGWPNFFARCAIVLILVGLCLVGLSVKMFGPAGLLNIWSKKEYIPSQYKSVWGKMLRDFGKPLKAGGLPLGTRADWNLFNCYMPRKLNMPPETRANNPHMLVLGSGSKGKSRLMASFAAHDIESNDRAVVVIDSDGGQIDLLLSWMAAHPKGAEMARRLVVVDPTHGSDSLAYNPLEFPDDGDLQSAASAVVFGFKAIYTEPPGSQSQWNQQTANILRNAAILLMANGKTLTDLPVLLSENDFRDVLLEKVERIKHEKAEYTTLLEAWAQYKRLARTDQWINWVEPILNRVQPMLGDPRIRPILTKPKGDLNLKEIISEGKILFVKVPQGQLDQNASLLGSLIVTGIKQAALSLSFKNASRKHQCALYLDEMDNFIEKETYDNITSETRKFQIGFCGSSKSLQEMPEDYRNKIISNVGTVCAFSLVKKDGDMLGPQMFRVDGRKVKHQTLQNIFNKVNTAPQFELISDEEKLNIDRVVGQEERTYFCYLVGTVAGVFQMKTPDFEDIPDKDINWTLVDQIYARSVPSD